jgi:L-lactate permease
VVFNLRPTAFTAIGQPILAMSNSTTGKVIGGDAHPIVKISQNLEKECSPIIEVSYMGIILQ